jgi:integrase
VLRAILNTAVEDGLIRRNPCRVRGAGNDGSPERPVLTIEEVYAVADAVPDRYRVFVLLGTFASLRFGELAALRRRDIDLDASPVYVRRALAELQDGSLITKGPKSEAGKRVVAIPAIILPEVRRHLDEYAELGQTGSCSSVPRAGGFVGPISPIGSGHLHVGELASGRTSDFMISGTPGTTWPRRPARARAS